MFEVLLESIRLKVFFECSRQTVYLTSAGYGKGDIFMLKCEHKSMNMYGCSEDKEQSLSLP